MSVKQGGDRLGSKAAGEEPPPFLRTWKRLYVAIAIYTCALILALFFMTIALNR